MKVFLLTILILLFTSACTTAQTFYGTSDVKAFREGRDKEFRERTQSPLLDADFQNFKGLNYFPVDENYRVKAKFVKTADEKYFMMPTTSGAASKYIKIGVFNFKIGDKELSLAAYQSELVETNPKWKEKYGNSVFIPFKDSTNGKETYGAGRYIYLNTPAGEDAEIDFNLAFNPSCAYGNDKYACPLPPKENFLQAEIKAGEKKFEYAGKNVIQD